MPTVEQILRESGFTDEQIKALDPKAITAFSGVLSSAQAERERAELEHRANVDFYENKIAPSLTAWDEEKQRIENEKARAAAEAAFYRTQAEEAKRSGFIASEAPSFVAPAQAGYRAGAPGGTPGSPVFDVNKVYERAGDAIGVLTDIQWEHQRLFGQPLPISPSELVRQADAVKLDPKTYAARQFGWDARRQEQAKRAQEEHDREIAARAVAENDRKWAERVGSNPDIRVQQANPRFTDITRAVRAGQRPDPLMLNDQQRSALTKQNIREDIAAQE